ncbi:helix-turn-helix domain-containing protein [Streptomyces sp. NPDC006967]|uniref:helix-turn-helix domain-containing protein n=1 Tax=Streptomyces sp. NPDC006967 TaxID=3156906 RepID=UPI0033F6ACFC
MTAADDLVVLEVPRTAARGLERALMLGLLAESRATGAQPTPETARVVQQLHNAARVVQQLHNAAHGHRRFDPEPEIVTPGTVDARVRALFGAAQAAQVLGCTAKHVRYLCRTERLRAQRVGSTWLIDPEDLHAFRIERRETAHGITGPTPTEQG